MVRHNLALLIAHGAVLLFLAAHCHDLESFKEITLIDKCPTALHRIDGCLVDDICQVRSNQPGRSQSDCLQIHRFIHLDILGVNTKRLQPPFLIGFIHDNPAIKAPRSKKRFVQHLRPVRRRQYEQSL